MPQSEIEKYAKIIWDYHNMNHELKKADCIFVLGSYDTRVAERAADLYLEGYAPYIIFSGGFGRFTNGKFERPEADIFADIAISRGVPEENIIRENKSTNTGENIQFTKKLLEEKGLNFNSFILVQKPYMERRTFATFKKNWPEKDFTVTSPKISFEEYHNDEITREKIVHCIVGDLQRIKEYPAKGFQIHQEIPDIVWNAYQKLVEAGFTEQLIKS